jgi:cystathionine gamma-synthase/methionine-gamma-lyase
MKDKSFATRAVHAGEHAPQGNYVPVATPIHPSVGYVYDSMDELDAVFATTQQGYVYPRYGSPTVAAFEAAIANLEGGEAAHAFASGMAAIHATLLAAGVRAGTTVVAALDVYGATYTLLNRLFTELGATVRLVDVADLTAVEAALEELHPVALVAETISNPLLKVANVPALAELTHRSGTQFVLDNTFATPYLFNPLQYGVDFVVHSATKYIGGHGDVMAGVVITSAANRRKLYDLVLITGGNLGPFEAWLALRGLKTLPLRIRKQFDNTARIATWLAEQPKIAQVNHPSLPAHRQHQLACQLFGEGGFGGVLSFEIAGADKDSAFRFMERLKLCLPATTLGDIYTLVLHPATTSHRALSPEARAHIGISDGLIRLSAGIEDVEDIITDLEQALGSTDIQR